MKKTFLLATGLLLLLAATTFTFAKSSDRDSPTPVNSAEITGNMDDHGKESFYSFTAGPGEVTITVDVKAQRENQGLLNFEVLARNGATPLECCHFAQGNGGGTGRDVATFKLTKRQTVILHTTNGPIGGGTFRIRIAGATMFNSASGGGPGKDSGESLNSDSNGDQLTVPSSGVLHIRMKNGTTRDIDLSLIRSITVRDK
ncbi:MAG: hypothetical protein ABJB40_11605 [Acidobacteriota bacterium]